jgi:hypothetical protein
VDAEAEMERTERDIHQLNLKIDDQDELKKELIRLRKTLEQSNTLKQSYENEVEELKLEAAKLN